MSRAPGTYAIFETSQGNIVIRLLEKEAPKTVANFVELAEGSKEFTDPKSGKKAKRPFYDGLTFHRVIPNFMIQGGCPLGTGTGDPGIHPSGKFLYVITALNTVSGFLIDQTTGALAELPNSPYSFGGVAIPRGIAADNTGRFLFVVADSGSDSNPTGPVISYKVDQATGELTPTGTPLQSGVVTVALLANPKINDIYLFGNIRYSPTVPLSMVFRGYAADPVNGILIPPSSMGAPSSPGTIARSMAISPRGTFLFIGHGQNEGFIQTLISSSSGSPLTRLGTRQFPISMAVDASEQFIYVVIDQAGPDNLLRGYSIDPATRLLTELPLISPFTNLDLPRVVTTDPLGPFLYAATSSGVRGYRIGTNGSLTAVPGSPFGFLPEKMVISRGLVQTITGPAPALSKSSLQFGTLDLGAISPTQLIDLGNIGNQPLTNIAISLDNTLDFRQTSTCTTTLLPDQKCAITVFKPLIDGPRSATLSVSSNAGLPLTASLQGTGQGTQALTPIITLDRTSVDFGGVVVSVASPGAPIRVTNTGQAALNVLSASISTGLNPGDFFVQSNTCLGAPVQAGGNCIITPAFKPTSVGIRSATLQIFDNAPGTHTISLVGNGNSLPFTLDPASGLPPSTATTVTVTAGQIAQFSLQITPARDSLGPLEVALSCAGAPQGATCTIPARVTTSNGTAAPITVSIATTARSGVSGPMAWPSLLSLNALYVATLALTTMLVLLTLRLVGNLRGTTTRPAWNYAVFAAVLILFFFAGACGGGSSYVPPPPVSTGTPAGTFTVTASATANTTTQQLPLTLIVK